MKNKLSIFLSFVLLVAVLSVNSVDANNVYIYLDYYYPNGYYPDPAEYEDTITFEIYIVPFVTANLAVNGVTYPLTRVGIFKYTTTVPASNIGVGISAYTVEAVDAHGDTNIESGTVEVVDYDEPVISSQYAYPNTVVYSETVTIYATVTDNVEVSTVTVTIDSTDYTMTDDNSDDVYEADIDTTLLAGAGTYYYTITATDTSGNEDSTDSTDYFDVIEPDTTPPVIDETSITEVDDPVEYDVGTIAISVDVTDDSVELAEVTLTIDGVTYPFPMDNGGSGDTYSVTIDPEEEMLGLDTYDYTIYAEDTSGNSDTSAEYDFVVQDTTSPVIDEASISEDTDPIEYGDSITITATITDNYRVDPNAVTLVIDGKTLSNEDMEPTGTTDEYGITINTEELGEVDKYYYTITAYDTKGQYDTATGNFVVQDTTPPVLEDYYVPTYTCYGESFSVWATATDIVAVETVLINIDDTDNYLSEVVDDTYTHAAIISTELSLDEHYYSMHVYDSSGNPDETDDSGFLYIIDCDDPVISDITVNPTIEYGETFTISATITDETSEIDDETVILTIDGIDDTFPMSDDDGDYVYEVEIDSVNLGTLETYTFTITAEDEYENNAEPETGSFEIVDTRAPVIDEESVTEDPADQVGYTEAITITATVTDNYKVATVRITDSTAVIDKEMEPTENEKEYSIIIYSEDDGLALGTYYYTITAYDTEDLYDTTTGNFKIVDNIEPEISEVSDNGPVQYGEDITITATVTDEFGIASVTIDISGVTLSDNGMTETDDEYSITIDTAETLGAIGTYSYTITAIDTNGNDYTTEDEYTFVVYDEDPVIHSVDASPNPVEIGADVTFTADVTDDVEVGTVSLYIDELEFAEEMEYNSILELYSLTIDSSIIGVGEYDYYVYAIDTYSNGPNDDRMDSEIPLEVIESENPVVSNLNAEPNPVRNDEILTFSATVTDNGEFDYVTVVVFNTENENVVEQMTETDTNYYEVEIDPSSEETMLDIGELTYYIVAKDTAGNYNNTESATVVVYDTTGPDIENLEVEPEVANQGEAVIISAEITDDDGVASVTLDIDGITLDNNEMEETAEDEYSITIDTSDLNFGTYEFTITATDSYGNPTKETGEFEIAATPPEITTVVAEPERLNQGETVIISAEVTDDESVEEVKVTIDGEEYDMLNTEGNTYVYEFDTNDMELGVYDFTITATDNYGNTATSTGTFTITIVSPISVEIRSDKTSGNADLDVSFSSSVTGGAGQLTYIWNFGDGYDDANKNVRHVFGKDGTFTVTLTVKDQYGNEGTDTVTIIVSEEKVSKESRNLVRVKGVSFKDDTIEAGERLDAYVTIENTGKNRLEDISFTIAIPELGILAKSKPDDVRENDTETEHLSLEIPYDAEPGIYDVRITISNDDMKRVKHREIRIVN